MGRSVNLTILLGNVGADPEIRYTSNGTPVARFSLATNSQYTDTSTGELKEITSWHNLVMYGKKPADVIQKYVKKGNPLHVVGHIAYRTWTDNDKVRHHHTAIVIDSFTLLGRPTDPDDGGGTVVVDADHSSELHDDNPF